MLGVLGDLSNVLIGTLVRWLSNEVEKKEALIGNRIAWAKRNETARWVSVAPRLQ